jgi:hypothetical protein
MVLVFLRRSRLAVAAAIVVGLSGLLLFVPALAALPIFLIGLIGRSTCSHSPCSHNRQKFDE